MCNTRALSDCTTDNYRAHGRLQLPRDPQVSKGAYHLAKKIRKFSLKVKWNSNFPQNPFRNCRLPPARGGAERRKFPYDLLNRFPVFSLSKSLISRKQLREIKLQMVSAISFGWFADFGKTLTII